MQGKRLGAPAIASCVNLDRVSKKPVHEFFESNCAYGLNLVSDPFHKATSVTFHTLDGC